MDHLQYLERRQIENNPHVFDYSKVGGSKKIIEASYAHRMCLILYCMGSCYLDGPRFNGQSPSALSSIQELAVLVKSIFRALMFPECLPCIFILYFLLRAVLTSLSVHHSSSFVIMKIKWDLLCGGDTLRTIVFILVLSMLRQLH